MGAGLEALRGNYCAPGLERSSGFIDNWPFCGVSLSMPCADVDGGTEARRLAFRPFLRWVLLLGVMASVLSGTVSRGQDRQSPAKPLHYARGPIDVLTDTKGFNIKPYLREIAGIVRSNWTWVMPDTVRGPKREQGYVAVDFRVTKDGNITDVTVRRTSESNRLDRAAYRAITGSSPLPAFPGEFQCEFLKLRFHFYYNERPSDEGGIDEGAPDDQALPCVTSKVIPVGDPVLAVSPGLIRVVTGTKIQFSAKMDGLADAAVVWSVAGPGCEGSVCGIISAAGLYTAPAKVPSPAVITVTATTVAPAQRASSAVTIVAPDDSH